MDRSAGMEETLVNHLRDEVPNITTQKRLKTDLGAKNELVVYSELSLQKLWKPVVFTRRKGLMVKGEMTLGKGEVLLDKW